MKTLFETIQAAGIEHANHESDLYLPITPEVTAILKNFPNIRPTRFRNQITGTMWYDVPFAFQPWWEKRAARALGSIKSPAKSQAARENGAKGGRPKTNNTAIRAHLLADDRNIKVRITRSGDVHVFTDRQRGDGGKSPWWMFAGKTYDMEFRSL